MISLYFCTFGVEAANDDCLNKHSMQKRPQPEESVKTDIVVSQSI